MKVKAKNGKSWQNVTSSKKLQLTKDQLGTKTSQFLVKRRKLWPKFKRRQIFAKSNNNK